MSANFDKLADGERIELFREIGSQDFLQFNFGRSYATQIDEAVAKTGKFCAITVHLRVLKGMKVIWMEHDFEFLGGSLGCAEGQKITAGFEFATQYGFPVVIECRSGGARMQEGTLSLMQMAKVSVALKAFKNRQLPYIAINKDPTYGGVSASYAMQGDVRIGIAGARIGFAGPSVILNTVYKMDQATYDKECPQGFQTAEYLKRYGQLDMVIEDEGQIDETVANILNILWKSRNEKMSPAEYKDTDSPPRRSSDAEEDKERSPRKDHVQDYTLARKIDRVSADDVLQTVFKSYIELSGDGKVSSDPCIRGGIALLNDRPCVVLATHKGHDANFGMANPAGYRIALKLMNLAEHFEIPVITLIDTVGAYPSFDSEQTGQSEALATNLLTMAGLRVPIVCLVLGEAGSGGALAIGMGDRIAMLSNAYYTVISPEGAASILGRYKDEDHKAQQFPIDCRDIANMQKIYAPDLKKRGVIDRILWEYDGEVTKSCPLIMNDIQKYLSATTNELLKLTPENLVQQRYKKYNSMGFYKLLSTDEIANADSKPKLSASQKRARNQSMGPQSKTLKFIADRTLNSPHSAFLGKQPSGVLTPKPVKSRVPRPIATDERPNAKYILDKHGPEAVSKWLRQQQSVKVTDTTMRDAHQSLLATRVRTVDLLGIASEASTVMHDAFSLEVWGGATYDVCYRFLGEDPWERLRLLRKHIPNIMLQMLIRGSNAVGYKSYPDNVNERFVELAAKNGIDVFRIFDCFNSVEQMQLCIDTVRKHNKIAEVCISFTGDFLSANEKIYTLEYFKDLAKRITEAGAHIIGIKDMAGLMKPQMVAPFVNAIRSVTDLPLHFHTHNTSSAALSTVINMANNGCDVVDLAMASMADTTSQPSMNAFLAALEGSPRDPKIPYLSLERLDVYWSQVRTQYQPFESGLKCGSARVFEHQIPGGQYSNLYAQCKDLGLLDRWDDVVDMYRDVNRLFGDIVKVTPSSKCVGDMALFLIQSNISAADVLTKGKDIEFPESVVDLFMGLLGFPHHGLPKDVQEVILKGRKPLTTRPGAMLKPVDFDAKTAELEAKYGQKMTPEDVITSIIYPKVFEEYMDFLKEYGWKVSWLTTEVFLSGMVIGQIVNVYLPEVGNPDNLLLHKVELKRVGPLNSDGTRNLEFLVNDQTRKVRVVDKAAQAGKVHTRKADMTNSQHVPSPLPGAIEVMYVGVGSEVKKGEPLMLVTAMKMAVQVVAPHDGRVTEITVQVKDRVDVGSLLAIVAPKN
jgi:acetyl-CoA carboxylase carboxyl transferase alpha subunit